MALDSKILVLVKPSIVLAESSIADMSSAETGLTSSKLKGNFVPYVQIGDYRLSELHIDSLIIDETETTPTMRMMYTDVDGNFGNIHFPKNNIICSVYFKSNSSLTKPVRCDFLITNIQSLAEQTGDLKGATYIIAGQLFIPNIYGNSIKAHKDKTSLDALKEIAKDLGLGFATNEVTTNDAMTWIMPNLNQEDWIHHITKHAYKNDDTFFTSFIDKYYNLNFVNVNNQFLQDTEVDEGPINPENFNDIKKTDQENKDAETTPIFLTNRAADPKAFNKIVQYSLISDQGDIISSQGLSKRIYYYDHYHSSDYKEKFLDFFAKPIVTDTPKFGGTSLIPEETGLLNIFNTTESRKWVGISYDNNHKNYIPAKLINTHNLKEINKIQLKVLTVGANTMIPRGSRIPVLIQIPGAVYKDYQTQYDSKEDPNANFAKDNNFVYDPILTDFYYVSGCKIIYDKTLNPGLSSIFTEYYLTKRNWRPSPKINKDIT